MTRLIRLLITYRAYHAILYALITLVIANMTRTPVAGPDYIAIVLCSITIFTWNTVLDREEDAIDRPDNDQAFLQRHATQGLSLGAAGAVVVLAIALRGGNLAAFSCMAYVLLAAFLYSQRFVGLALKQVFILKTVVAITIWLGLTVFYPVLNSRPAMSLAEFTLGHWAAAVWVATFFAAGETVSDIKDIEGDRAAGATTLPMKIGIGGTLMVSSLISLPGLVWIGGRILDGRLAPHFWFMAGFPVALNAIFLTSYVLVRRPEHCVVRSVWMQDRAVYGYLLILLLAAIWPLWSGLP